MVSILKKVKKAVVFVVVLLLICGIGYPLLLTGISQAILPYKANGSVIEINGIAYGSEIVGQDFQDTRFMKCRPSAVNYNTYTEEEKEDGTYGGVASGSANYGPTNSDLIARVEGDIAEFLENNPEIKKEDIPTDLLTASGSGLDPHISPASAKVQIPALANATGLEESKLNEFVADNTRGKFLGIFGEETVNVLKVNLEIAKELGIVVK